MIYFHFIYRPFKLEIADICTCRHTASLRFDLKKNQGFENFELSPMNICCGYSKEPSPLDGSFEHPTHTLKPMGKKIFTILR